MSRLSALAENSLEQLVMSLRRQVDDLKEAQRMGSGSVRFHRVYSDDPYDVQFNYSTDLQLRTIRFTPDDTTYANLGAVYKMDRFAFTDVPDQMFALTIERQPIKPDGVQEWKMYCVTPIGTSWIRVKLYFYTICAGTFSIS